MKYTVTALRVLRNKKQDTDIISKFTKILYADSEKEAVDDFFNRLGLLQHKDPLPTFTIEAKCKEYE